VLLRERTLTSCTFEKTRFDSTGASEQSACRLEEVVTRAEPSGENPNGQILLYRSEDGRMRLDVRLEKETVWLNQRQLTDLFGKAKGTISEHIKHIFEDDELDPRATVRSFRTVQLEGGREVVRDVEHYNLEMVLALGFRVRSPAAVRFRQWAAERLKEYIVKGFALDDERLKRTDRAADYFDELLARIREIRASEARVYQRIREILGLASAYDESDQDTLRFFAFMQNKMHHAATAPIGGRDRPASRGCREAQHGANELERRSRSQARRGHDEELPRRQGDRHAEPHRRDVPRPR